MGHSESKSMSCGSDREKIDGLCYRRCPNGMSHIAGMPYLCSASFTKSSHIVAPHSAQCPKGRSENIAGLCYESPIRNGYSRQSLGLLSQDCPSGTTDFGVGCIRESYWRDVVGLPMSFKAKKRK